MDKRKHYVIVLDTETANGQMIDGKLNLNDSLVYDVGWAVVDTKGTIYEKRSFVVKEIFRDEAEMMKSAYYANKLPRYEVEIAQGLRKVETYYNIRKQLLEDCKVYGITEISAHNARFDYNALNVTQRWLTKSKYRYFLPYGVEMWDTLKMACQVVKPMKTYKKFCSNNGYMTKHKIPQERLTAEILYRFISGNNDFEEAHTGLEDVEIETQILWYCLRKHKKMIKELWEK